ncbi:rCG57839 [Rattus norvegicus]|uniref:RCG57839 n=1 Tax=Rattus norvegicus TaxID=10116 RepID=A6J4V0_RAT|nr:rCG57839 [Rattus norvegicus]
MLPLSISCPICLSSFLAQTYWPCLALPLRKPVTSVWPSCSGPGMLHLQATMHFHEEGMREMGLCTDGLLEGWEGPVDAGDPPVCCQLLHSGAHCPLFLRDTRYPLVGS